MFTPRLRITQSLLSAYNYSFVTDSGYEDFLKALNRIKTPPTKAMLDGIRFENVVNSVLDGAEIDPSNDLYEPVMNIVPELSGSQKQVTIFREVDIDGTPFLLHGVLDFLKAGVIYDTKFSKTYSVGKYLKSPQTPMYFALVPEAYRFEYIICDGKWVYRESYRPDEVEPIERLIVPFMDFLEKHNLMNTYIEKWKVGA